MKTDKEQKAILIDLMNSKTIEERAFEFSEKQAFNRATAMRSYIQGARDQ